MLHKVIICSLVCCVLNSQADTTSSDNKSERSGILVIDMEKIAYSSNIIRKLQQRLKREKIEFDKECEEKKKNLKKMEEELRNKQKIAKSEAQKNEIKELEKKLQKQKQDFQSEIDAKADEMELMHQKALNDLGEKMRRAGKKILKKKNGSIILPANHVVAHSEDVQDATDEMIAESNSEED
ncbi:OmpH family outer membrane protein [Candidatus Cytomitobacter indipagum]|uniref:OmpH family outer membrane protein n=1 Tax=Candidatus Cytomitobacter indipagum TaxID=2601575 RepID=A0A5C0UG58_9PROT|nr:OmpH family outer membrane protein [Candidatus Cytomitobacter indipagum]QEK38252.1 OmpH family outer membrane protein [Candidatus Cytomitobacter indipagum]